MQESAYNTHGSRPTFSLQPVLKTYVSDNEIKTPNTYNACLSDNTIEKLYTVCVQHLTPYVNSDNTSSYYTCIDDTIFDEREARAIRGYKMYNNLCESFDHNMYVNYLNAYDPVEHTYEGNNTSNFIFLTNSTYFSAEPVGQYEIPSGYDTTTYNYIQISSIYDIYKNIPKNTVNVTDEITAKVVSDGIPTKQYTSIEYSDEVVPLSLGCSIIFSATQLPDKFLYVGIKGRNTGNPAMSVGKVYSPTNIKSLGNNLYLFNDVICDNLQFMTDALHSSQFYDTVDVNDKHKILTSAFKFSTTFVLDSELKYHTTIQNVETSDYQDKDITVANTRKLENFNAISVLQWLTCAKLNLDNALQIEPATASILPRYNSAATIHLAKNDTRYIFHSNIAYNDNSSLGYAGFSIDSAVTAIKNWGDVSLINEMVGVFNNTNLQKIPNSWLGWDSLNYTEGMFAGAGITAIPNTWNGLSAVRNTRYMFIGTHFSSIPNSWAGLDSLEDAEGMFKQSNVNNLPLDLFEKCSNIQNISEMFLQCYHLTAQSADVEEFIKKAEDKFTNTSSYYQCFLHCSAIENYETLKTKYPNWFYPQQ
jgi:hypothetical protein